MVTIEPENLLLLNDSLEYIQGAGGLEPTSPRRINFRSGFEITLTSVGFNRNLNTQLPALSDITWLIPSLGNSWTNRDITIFGHLLSLAPLRFSPEPIEEKYPLPSDFITAMVKEKGTDGWSNDVGKFALDLLSRLGIQFRAFGENQSAFGGGFEASLFEKRYLSLALRDIESRDRILTWLALPAVNSDSTKLMTAVEDDSALTWGQNGVVTSSLCVPNSNHNQLIQSDDTSLRVITPDIRIKFVFRREELPEPRWAAPHLSVHQLDEELEGPSVKVGWIERKVTTEEDDGQNSFVGKLRAGSNSVNEAFENGSLKVERGRLLFHFEGATPVGTTFLSVVPHGHTVKAVKEVLLVGADDFVQQASFV